jgi:uncharacterized tellurite resistance protein B-like protein
VKNEDLAAYLAAAAWADGPMSESECSLVENLLYCLGLERTAAADMLKGWEFKAPTPPDLASLTDRGQGVALLRALLILSYSDGHFGMEELPYLTKILDKFKIPTDELVQLRLQAQFYLEPEAPEIPSTAPGMSVGDWSLVESSARESRSQLRARTEHQVRETLKTASLDSLVLILYRGRSYDLVQAHAEFEKRRADLLDRHGAMHDDRLLQTQITLVTMAKWDRLYSDRCSGCGLAAPGRKGSPCPRCGEDYS